jgi:hypothetical protein
MFSNTVFSTPDQISFDDVEHVYNADSVSDGEFTMSDDEDYSLSGEGVLSVSDEGEQVASGEGEQVASGEGEQVASGEGEQVASGENNNSPSIVEENKINIIDVAVTSENVALNILVTFVNLAQKRGAFDIRESAKIWECIQKFQRN